MNMHNFTHGTQINKVQYPLTIEAIQHSAPSALAVHQHESRSSRYQYIPTLDIIKGKQERKMLHSI